MAKAEDELLERYLKGKSVISEQYQKSEIPEVPKHVDEVVLSLANFSTNTQVNTNVLNKKWYDSLKSWSLPLSMMAVVTICFGLVFTMYDEFGEHYLSRPESMNLSDDAQQTSGLSSSTVSDAVDISNTVQEITDDKSVSSAASSLQQNASESTIADVSRDRQDQIQEIRAFEERVEADEIVPIAKAKRTTETLFKDKLNQSANDTSEIEEKKRLFRGLIQRDDLDSKETKNPIDELYVDDYLKDSVKLSLSDTFAKDKARDIEGKGAAYLNNEQLQKLKQEIEDLKETKSAFSHERDILKKSIEEIESKQTHILNTLIIRSEDFDESNVSVLKRINKKWYTGNEAEAKVLLVEYLLENDIKNIEQIKPYLPERLLQSLSDSNNQ